MTLILIILLVGIGILNFGLILLQHLLTTECTRGFMSIVVVEQLHY
jgi:hypothetical protein